MTEKRSVCFINLLNRLQPVMKAYKYINRVYLFIMKIWIDEREVGLYGCLTKNQTIKTPIIKKVLPLGDIIIKTDDELDVVIIERKSISDLLSSIKDGRYKEQSHRLIHSSNISPHKIIYLIEGVFQGNSPSEKQMVYSSIVSLSQIKGFSILRTWNIEETGQVILNMADKLQREMDKGNFTIEQHNSIVNESHSSSSLPPSLVSPPEYCNVVKKTKKENITPENMGEIILCQIPGISSVNAIAIMKPFTSFSQFLNTIEREPQYLENFQYETNGKTKKINKNIIENIKRFMGVETKVSTPSF